MADLPPEGGGARPGGASNNQSVLTRAQALRAVALSSAPLPSTTNAPVLPPVQTSDTAERARRPDDVLSLRDGQRGLSV